MTRFQTSRTRATISKNRLSRSALESQFYEGGCNGGPNLVPDPKNAAAVAARKQQVRGEYLSYPYYSPKETGDRFRSALVQCYGKERGEKVRYAEAFEVCEYGRKLEKDEISRLFPFFAA